MSSSFQAQQRELSLPNDDMDLSDNFSDSDSGSHYQMDYTGDDISDSGSEANEIFREQDIETLMRNFPDQWNPRDIDTLFRGFVLFLESTNFHDSPATGYTRWLEVSFSHHFRIMHLCERFKIIENALVTIRDEYGPAFRNFQKELRLEREQYIIPFGEEGNFIAASPQSVLDKYSRMKCIGAAMNKITGALCHYRKQLAIMLYNRIVLINEINGVFEWDEADVRNITRMEDKFSLHPEDCIKWDDGGDAVEKIHCQTCFNTLKRIWTTADEFGMEQARGIIWGEWDEDYEVEYVDVDSDGEEIHDEEMDDEDPHNEGSNRKEGHINGPCACPGCEEADEEMLQEEQDDDQSLDHEAANNDTLFEELARVRRGEISVEDFWLTRGVIL